MTRKLIAAAAALVMCFSMAACGNSDSSGKSDAISPWGNASSDAEEDSSKASESKNDESKADESKAEVTTASPAVTTARETTAEAVTTTEESKAEEPALTSEEPESQAEVTVSESEKTPSADGSFTVTGTGYTVEFSSKWVDFADLKDEIGQNTAEVAGEQFGLDTSEFAGMDSVVMYGAGEDEPSAVFNVVKPVVNAAFRSVKVSDLEEVLKLSIETQMAGTEGFDMKSKGIVKYNGEEFLELYTEYTIDDAVAKARQFFAIHGDKEFVISFSIPGEKYDELYDETEKVMKTFRFTEE